MAQAKSLSMLQIILILLAVSVFSITLTLLVVTPSVSGRDNPVKSLLPAQLQFSLNHPQKHIDALALQLGEMHARIMRLDALGERLEKMVGIKDKDALPPPGTGGPQVQPQSFTESQLQDAIDDLARQVEIKSDRLSMLETLLIQRTTQSNVLPDARPVAVGYNSSSYGWRADPFSGHRAFHEGLDFPAQVGTPIHAAAGGIVTVAERTHDYGNIVKISHGAGMETRYAHASRLLVNAGEVVKKGQLIALVGSTGRSTGPHLHFEVRREGVPLDPRKFLQKQ